MLKYLNYNPLSPLDVYAALLKAIFLLTAIPLYIGFCVKIGHSVGLGYKVQRFLTC